jgi:DNA-binding response OmpR family regulator
MNIAANMTKNTTILLATNDEVMSDHVTTALIKAGYKVILALDGYEAVRFCQEQEEIHIMILDTSLRGLNGYEVSRMIRESGNSEIIIILLAWFSVQSLEMANAVGCNELVAKVVNVQELVEVAGKWSEMDAKKLQNVTRNA